MTIQTPFSRASGASRSDSAICHLPSAIPTRAFSLLEMMVAVTLLLIIIAALLAMFYQTQRAFRLSATTEDILEGGRGAMELFASELPEITPCNRDSQVNLYAQQAYALLIQPRPTPLLMRTNLIQDIFFLRQHNDEWIGTGYFVYSTNDAVGSLYRFETNVVNVTNNLQIHSLFASFLAAVQENPPARSHQVMDRVIDLKLVPYDAFGRAVTNPVTGRLWSPLNYSFSNLSVSLPAYVDLELGIFEPRAYEKYKSLAEISSPTDPRGWIYLSNHVEKVHLFTERFPLRASTNTWTLF